MNEYEQLWSLISKRYGLLCPKDWEKNLKRAADKIIKSKQLLLNELVQLADRDDAILRQLAGYLTIEESYFFRHPEHYEILVEHLIQKLSTYNDGGGVFIWSAGCSKGQEPYSIAMSLKERFTAADCARVSIIGTDLNPTAVAFAEMGVFDEWSFRTTDERRRLRFFTRTDSGRSALRDEIRKMVRFSCTSMREQAALLTPESVDCIFYRNVSIYLSDEAQREIYSLFAQILKPDGLLFLAPSDIQPSPKLFTWSGGDTTSVYALASAKRKERPYYKKSTVPTEMFIVPRISLPPPKTPYEIEEGDPAVRAIELADRGEFDAALRAAEDMIEGEPNGKMGYLVRGQIQFARDTLTEAIDDFRRALFIAPEDSIIRFWYAFGLHRAGAVRRALIHINKLESKLSDESGGSLLEDGRTTAGELLKATRQLKELLQ